MSKYLNVPTGDYKITVQEGGTITLDTGADLGEVVISGNLIVKGETTTMQTETVIVEDNILLLNRSETGQPTETTSGIEINRDTHNAQVLFDETALWQPPTGGLQSGAWIFKNTNGSLLGIRTNSITTGGGNLNLINSGSGVISVTGTTDYEDNVIDPDHVPNKQYVDDYVEYYFNTFYQPRIEDGSDSLSYIQITDFETSGTPSVIDIGIDATSVAAIYSDRIELNDLIISGTEIKTAETSADLVLKTQGIGSVRIDDSLVINTTPSDLDFDIDPALPTDGVKLYAKLEAEGGTGLYFINSENTQDELISRNRALLYSMLF